MTDCSVYTEGSRPCGRAAFPRGTWSRGCFQSGRTCQCHQGLAAWKHCWLSASGSHTERCEVGPVNPTPSAARSPAPALAGESPWGLLATCFPSQSEGQSCFSAHLEFIFALEVVQEVLVVGVTHLAEQREKAGHILTLRTNPENT